MTKDEAQKLLNRNPRIKSLKPTICENTDRLYLFGYVDHEKDALSELD
jgi:hypothetical protein